jgi:integrase
MLQRAQIAAGLTVERDGKRVLKYTDLHCLRHFFASWCINRRVDGGSELPLKTVQAQLGHATLTMPAHVYGNLFPSDATTTSWRKPKQGLACARRELRQS